MVFLWCFLPVDLLGCFLLQTKFRNGFLLAASLVFYAWGEPGYIWLMLISVAVNYLFGLLVDRTDGVRQKFLLALDVVANLWLLGYFKYANFFVDTVNQISPGAIRGFGQIALPIGISFYTFQAMSYVIDVYRRDCRVQKNPVTLGLYITCFPQLIAGPIVKYHDVALQLENRTCSMMDFSCGIRRFVYGLAKKVLIANPLGAVADAVFRIPSGNLGTGIAWLGAICYTLQIYYDFSGYSDMAIGLGRMFGFRFPENFNYPYLTCSIKEFWTRWHISLSTWFKEYLYIPLGGNRCGSGRTYLNLIIVFLATGIWHGAAWTFLFWGLYHGTFILLERIFLKKYLDRPGWAACAHLYAMLAVIGGWVFFRAETLAQGVQYLRVMFIPAASPYRIGIFLNPVVWCALIGGVLFCGILQRLCPRLKTVLTDESRIYSWEYVLMPALLVLCVISLVANTYNPFIYFRF